MKTVLFSVIVPVYNTENYLEKCIDSILTQTISDFEILLIDDGSTDKSSLLCDAYQKQYDFIETYHLDSNQGQSVARNYGIEHSKGKYIIFIDSDDWVKRDALKNCFRCIQKNEDIDVITSNGKILVYRDKEFLSDYPISFEELDGKDGLTWVESFLRAGVDDWDAPGKCFKRKFWIDNGFAFKEGRLAEDIQLVYKVLMKAKSMTCCDTFYYYRQARPGSTITSGSEKLIRSVISNLEEWNTYLQEDALISNNLKQLLYDRFSKLYCTSVLSMLYAFPARTRKSLKNKAASIDYYLKIGNNYVVKMSRLVDRLFNRDILCLCLYFIRQVLHKYSKVKWYILGRYTKNS